MAGSAAVLRLYDFNYEQLSAQLDLSRQAVQGRVRQKLEEYLYSRGIDTLELVTDKVLVDYYDHIMSDPELGASQKAYYGRALEMAVLGFGKIEYKELLDETAGIGTGMRADRNKALSFLMAKGIREAKDITYRTRMDLEEYLGITSTGRAGEVLKILDKMKLLTIARENVDHISHKRNLKDPSELVYLGYHPDYEIALSFYYIQNKEELVFDFTRDVSQMMKKQFLDMLNHSLRIRLNRKNRREMYLLPLKLFYEYCCSAGISDINKLEQADIDGYYKSLDGNVGTKTKIYMQIVDNFRRFLFLKGSGINWEANVWYPERFRLKDDRANPAHSLMKFTFIEVCNKHNRSLLQKYMRYMIGLTGKSMNMIRSLFVSLKEFLAFCDREGIDAEAITVHQINKYAREIAGKDIQDEYKNQKIFNVARFYKYLEVEGIIDKCPFDPEMYKQKTYPVHHDRSVTPEIESEILVKLGEMAEDYRLMFLHLYCVGLRINEVCTLKGDAYIKRNGTSWIRVFQYKMKSEKVVPIPDKLRELMDDYISANDITPDDYVFRSPSGGACKCATFNKYMRQWCQRMDIGGGGYRFRSHDFRHSLATNLYDSGTSIQGVRDYLGHTEEDMTRQYIDYMPGKVDAANERYFDEHGSFRMKGGADEGHHNRRS